MPHPPFISCPLSASLSAKKIESRGMESNDGVNFDYGECSYTSLVIHAKRIQDSVCDHDDDDDDFDDGSHEVIVVPEDD